MNKIIDDLSTTFSKATYVKQSIMIHPQDTTGRSTSQGGTFFFKNGNVSIFCYLWVDPIKISNYVAVSTRTKEFNDWLNKKW